MAQALMRAGHDVYLAPTDVQAPLPRDVAELLMKPLVGPFDLGIVHVDPGQMKLNDDMRRVCTTLIGWTMWEYTSLANYPGHTKFKKQWKDYDALIAYDPVTANCLRAHYTGPIHTVQGGFDPDGFGWADRDWDGDPFFFGMIGVLSNRKNPWAAINAFAQLKHEHPDEFAPARLIMKTTGAGLHPGIEDVIPGVRIVYDVWSTDQVKDFYRRIHVLLAPSRGEGKNLPCLEALSTGAGVIATDWGGHQMWLDDAYAYRLGYDLVPADTYKPGGPRWADVHVEELKHWMLHALRNRHEVAQKGALGSLRIPENCSWDAQLANLFEKLEPVL